MKIPSEMNTYKNNQVCKPKKFLYGLKQASHKWFAKLSTFM